MTLTKKVEVIQKIADAVHAAHKNDLIHRDIKPSNIMLEKTESGEWKPYILDFGLARMQTAPGVTHQGVIIGTPHYMPPEQARGAKTDVRSDVYSLGATLYELLAGKPPFVGTTPEVLLQVLQDDVVPIQMINRQISADLKTIVMKCLDKEPPARYTSAKVLAEDLKRYLDGEPILARRVSMTTRAWKKAKKNRVASVIFATAIVITAALLSMLIFTRWKASVQTRYENEFGSEVRYVETMLLSTYTAPLHDIRPKLNLARNRLELIEERIKNGGKWAYGPGNNALGQGYLVLKQYKQAEEHLEKAWKSGYQNPSTAYALGKVKGILWRQSVIDSNLLPSASLQEEAKKKADQNYRRPAIQFLKDAQEYAESPAYVESLIFLYEKRHKEAFEKSRIALDVSSRPYEVLKLQGDIHYEIAQDALKRNEHDTALKAYQLAGNAYGRASEFARSDQEIYLADAYRWIRVGVLVKDSSEERAAFEKAAAYCDKALIVQPDNERSYLYKSEVYLQIAISHMYSSGDPKPALLQAIEMAREGSRRNPKSYEPHDRTANAFIRLAEFETAYSLDPRNSLKQANAESEKALALNPQDASAYVNLASAYFYIGEYELSHGENPVPSLQKVIDILQKDLKTFPRDDYLHNLLGLTYLNLGDYKLRRGQDPRPDLNHSIESYEAGLKKNPQGVSLYSNMGLAYINTAKYEMNYGFDPSNSIQQAIKQYDKCLAIANDYSFAYHDRGSAYLIRAEHKLRLAENPTTDITEAISSYKKSLETNPDLTFPHMSIGNGYFVRAQYSFKSGKDPSEDLKAAIQHIQNFMKKDSTYYEAYRILGTVELLTARWSIQNRRSPEIYFDRAITNLMKSCELNKSEISVYKDLASAYRYKAEWSLSHQKDLADSIIKGLQAIDNASKLSASDPETFAIHGSLKLLEARQAKNAAMRNDNAKEASQLLTRAIAANPFLKQEYEPLQKQAANFN
jgi:serine/threonine-protein kinase